jgi:hypothetical protein
LPIIFEKWGKNFPLRDFKFLLGIDKYIPYF